MPTDPRGIPPLKSQFIDDADMAELLDEFVETLNQRIQSIEAAMAADDHSTLRTLIHQLKGAGGGYGYPTITEIAADAELAIASGGRPGSNINSAAPQIQRLLNVCHAAINGYRNAA